MGINLRNIPAKYHPDTIWNLRASGFLKEVTPTRKEEQEQDEQR